MTSKIDQQLCARQMQVGGMKEVVKKEFSKFDLSPKKI